MTEMRVIIFIESICIIIRGVTGNPAVVRALTITLLKEIEFLFVLSYRPLKIANLSKCPPVTFAFISYTPAVFS